MTVYLATVHDTHQRQDTGYSIECHNCWGCSCHSPEILARSCTYSAVRLDVPTQDKTAQSVIRQSIHYGSQIRYLEMNGKHADVSSVKVAWLTFLKGLDGSPLRFLARQAYYGAYFRQAETLAS